MRALIATPYAVSKLPLAGGLRLRADEPTRSRTGCGSPLHAFVVVGLIRAAALRGPARRSDGGTNGRALSGIAAEHRTCNCPACRATGGSRRRGGRARSFARIG